MRSSPPPARRGAAARRLRDRKQAGAVALLLVMVLVLVLVLPASSWARAGTLAVVNAGKGGHALVELAAQRLGPWIGGWARQEGVAGLLAGAPRPGSLPSGQPGKELAILVERLRERQLAQAELAELGRLLGVDYLLLLQTRTSSYAARLFSVGLQRYAPQGLEVEGTSLDTLQEYVLAQTRAKPAEAKQGRSRWWIWGLVAGVVAVSLGLALSAGDDSSGDLRIRVVRP